MIKYIIRRLLLIVPVFLGVLLIVFTIQYFMPGDPVSNLLGVNYTQEQYDKLFLQLGLDQPFWTRFWNYLVDVVVHQDLGTSWQSSMPVSSEIAPCIGVSLKLGLLSTCAVILVGIPLGVLAAIKQRTVIDYTATTISVFFAAVPGFWLALMMMILFCLKLRWFPSSGISTWKHYILPVLCSSAMTMASTTRMTRSSMLEVIRSDYIRTARAKGVSEKRVIVRHALRNALIPIVTSLGAHLGTIIGGSVVIETIFSIPGMGPYLMTAIGNRNYPAVMGVVVVIALFISIMNIVVDLIYALIDPRIRAQFSRSGAKKRVKTEKGASAA